MHLGHKILWCFDLSWKVNFVEFVGIIGYCLYAQRILYFSNPLSISVVTVFDFVFLLMNSASKLYLLCLILFVIKMAEFVIMLVKLYITLQRWESVSWYIHKIVSIFPIFSLLNTYFCQCTGCKRGFHRIL